MTTPDEHRLIEQVREALEAEARRHPVPSDLAVSIVDGLTDRPVRQRFASLLSIPALAAAAVLAITATAVLLSLTRPSATLPGSSVSPTPAPELTRTYAIDYPAGVRFDYPASWRIIAEGIETRSYQWIAVVMGTGGWKLGETDTFTLAPGEIVVEMYTLQGPEPWQHLPPPTAFMLPNGWRAVVEDSTTTSIWQVYVPGWTYPLSVDARFADPGADDARSTVKRVVESMRLATVPAGSAAPSFSGAPSPSPTATDVVGNLEGGGSVALSRAGDVQFEQGGQVVASTQADDAGVFEIRLPPGAYDVVVTNFPGGCEGTHHITVYGSRQELRIQCNNVY